MSWVIDIEMYLESMGFAKTIKEMNSTSSKDKAKPTIFIHRYLSACLKCEYLTVRTQMSGGKISQKI